ncbi:MAG TPA: thermonuclease family protein [Flavipsychrobacter sp.]|nr:thermonuclease family protein [Flavipsychrobacter sp.]
MHLTCCRKDHFLYLFFIIFLAGCGLQENKEYDINDGVAESLYFNAPGQAKNSYKVTAIKDGDTFVILKEGKEQVIRLAHIDCPEKKQAFGSKARQYASQLCFGKYVTLKGNNKYDRNKRLIAEVFLEDGTNINKELVKAGLAWHFKKYSNDMTYAVLEEKARKRQIGIWSEKEPVAPWFWRKNRQKKSNEIAPLFR